MDKELAKKYLIYLTMSFPKFFIAMKDPFKKVDVKQKYFGEDLSLLIVKNHLPMQFVENP